MRKTIRIVVLGICCLFCGCGKRAQTADQANLATPKDAVRAYGKAMRDGDAGAAKRAVTNADPKVVEALAAMGSSRRRIIDAAAAKFGDDGKTVAGGSVLPYGQQFDKMLDDAEVKIDGDTATVTQKTGDAIPITLKRVGGDWKIDYSDITKRGDLIQMLPLMTAMATANDELADEIKSGKYATAADAKKAHDQKMQQAIMGRAKESNLPSSQPDSQAQ